MNQATDETPELLYQGEWLRMVKRGQWESCERTHGKDGLAVLVIAVTPDDHVLFVEQYRVPLGAKTIEMPAGLVGDDDASDTLESAARRELIEETGWDAARIDVLLVGPTTRSEEHTSELQSLMRISYAVFCLKKKKHTPEPQSIKITEEMHQDSNEHTTTIKSHQQSSQRTK